MSFAPRAAPRPAIAALQRPGFGARARGRTMMVAALAFGLLVDVFAPSRWLLPVLPFVVGIGLPDAAYAALDGAPVQTTVDDTYRGRVMALYSLPWGPTPIGSLEAGEITPRAAASRPR